MTSMAHPSAQRTIQPKTSTNKGITWKKKVKKACQLRELTIELMETEYLQEKVEATEVPIRMSDVVI